MKYLITIISCLVIVTSVHAYESIVSFNYVNQKMLATEEIVQAMGNIDISNKGSEKIFSIRLLEVLSSLFRFSDNNKSDPMKAVNVDINASDVSIYNKNLALKPDELKINTSGDSIKFITKNNEIVLQNWPLKFSSDGTSATLGNLSTENILFESGKITFSGRNTATLDSFIGDVVFHYNKLYLKSDNSVYFDFTNVTPELNTQLVAANAQGSVQANDIKDQQGSTAKWFKDIKEVVGWKTTNGNNDGINPGYNGIKSPILDQSGANVVEWRNIGFVASGPGVIDSYNPTNHVHSVNIYEKSRACANDGVGGRLPCSTDAGVKKIIVSCSGTYDNVAQTFTSIDGDGFVRLFGITNSDTGLCNSSSSKDCDWNNNYTIFGYDANDTPIKSTVIDDTGSGPDEASGWVMCARSSVVGG